MIQFICCDKKLLSRFYPVQMSSFLFCHLHYISICRLTVWYGRALWPDTTLMKALDLSNQGLLYLSSCSPLSFPFWKKRRNTHLKSMWIIILNSSILPDLFSYDHNSLFYFNSLWMYCSSVTCKTKHHKNKRKSLPVVAQYYKPIAHCRFWNTSCRSAQMYSGLPD